MHAPGPAVAGLAPRSKIAFIYHSHAFHTTILYICIALPQSKKIQSQHVRATITANPALTLARSSYIYFAVNILTIFCLILLCGCFLKRFTSAFACFAFSLYSVWRFSLLAYCLLRAI